MEYQTSLCTNRQYPRNINSDVNTFLKLLQNVEPHETFLTHLVKSVFA